METNLIRCINTKTGVVKFLSPSVVNNRHFMSKYKWKREDLAEPMVPMAVVEEELPSNPATNVSSDPSDPISDQDFPNIPAPEFIDTEEAAKVETTTAVKPPKAKALPKAPRKPRKTTKK